MDNVVPTVVKKLGFLKSKLSSIFHSESYDKKCCLLPSSRYFLPFPLLLLLPLLLALT